MRVLQLGPDEVDEQGKTGSDLQALWRERGAEFAAAASDDDGGKNGGGTALVASGGAGGVDLKELDLGYSVPRWYQMLVLFQRAFIDGLKDQDKFMGGLVLKAREAFLL